jgi:hypothetical protein
MPVILTITREMMQWHYWSVDGLGPIVARYELECFDQFIIDGDRLSFLFDVMLIDADGQTCLIGGFCATMDDRARIEAGEVKEVIRVDPPYFASRLVLHGQPIPHALRHLAKFLPPDCPVRVDDPEARVCSIFVEGEWLKQKPISPGDLRVIEALIDSHPKGLTKEKLSEESEVPAPWKNLDKLRRPISQDWITVIRMAGTERKSGYGLKAPMDRAGGIR